MFEALNDPAWWAALMQVIVIDLTLAGDNAIVIGMAAAGVALRDRARVILFGLAAAVVLRIVFAAATTQLLQVIGLTLAGGLLLLWVAWRMWRDIRAGGHVPADENRNLVPDSEETVQGTKTVGQAIVQIVVADVSMSLDNVLAVAGAAMEHASVLVFGLLLSIALMGAAATLIARLLHRYPGLAYAGLAMIIFVAGRMILEGGHQVVHAAGFA